MAREVDDGIGHIPALPRKVIAEEHVFGVVELDGFAPALHDHGARIADIDVSPVLRTVIDMLLLHDEVDARVREALMKDKLKG